MEAVKEKNKNIPLFILMGCVAVGITVSTPLVGQSFIRVFPLYISLFIMFLQTRVNRYAFLLGGLNSIIYAAIYFYYTLYASAFYAFLFSFPLQIITFIRWSKHRYKQATIFRKMTAKQRAFVAAGFFCTGALIMLILSLTNAGYAMLDTSISLLGILATFLTMLAFIEAPFLGLISGLISIILYINMMANGVIEQLPYLIYNFYSYTCVIMSFRKTIALYREQQALKK